MQRLIQRLRKDERGGAIAEFLLGMIPLVIAFALIFEFGRAFWSHQAAIKGVRDATRYLTRVEDPTDATAQAIAERLLLTGQQAAGGTARWSSGSSPALDVDVFTNQRCDGSPATATFRAPPGGVQIVKVSANVELILPLRNVFALFGGDSLGTVTYAVSDCGRHYGR